jgi:molybdate transport system permease protein
MSSIELKVIWLTIKVAIFCTIITIPIAIWLGWVLTRKKIFGKPIIEALISLPLVAPPVITGYILLILFGKNGWIGRWIYKWFEVKLAFNFIALVIASVTVSLPLAVRSIRSSFEMIDPAYEKVSLTLGASKVSTFFKVSLPMAIPGVLSGMVLSFARSLGEFGATITLAGNIVGKTQTIALMVYSNMQIPGMEVKVIRLVIVSIIISFIAITVSEIINRRKRYIKR